MYIIYMYEDTYIYIDACVLLPVPVQFGGQGGVLRQHFGGISDGGFHVSHVWSLTRLQLGQQILQPGVENNL